MNYRINLHNYLQLLFSSLCWLSPQSFNFILSLSRSQAWRNINPARGIHALKHYGIGLGKDQLCLFLRRREAKGKWIEEEWEEEKRLP